MDRNRNLVAVTVETTLRCDHACVFCGSRAGARAAGELTTAEIRSVFEQAARMGAKQAELTGGETYLREDWLELIRAAKDLGLECALITAGRGIDAQKAQLAKDAGLDRVGVSIDGLGPTHDALRGVPGSFDQARRAIAHFLNAGVKVGCNTQVNAKNFRELPALGDVLIGLGLYAWQIQLMVPMGRAATDESLWLQPYDLLEVIPLIARVIDVCDAHGLVTYAGDNVGYFGPHEQVLRRHSSRAGHTFGCAAGLVGMGVDPIGNIKPCSGLDGPEYAAGNVRKDALAALWERSPVMRLAEHFSEQELWGACASCYYASICQGGCTLTATALTGRRGNNPYCHHRALELARRGLRERLVPRMPVDKGLRGFIEFDVQVEPMPPSAPEPGPAAPSPTPRPS